MGAIKGKSLNMIGKCCILNYLGTVNFKHPYYLMNHFSTKAMPTIG